MRCRISPYVGFPQSPLGSLMGGKFRQACSSASRAETARISLGSPTGGNSNKARTVGAYPFYGSSRPACLPNFLKELGRFGFAERRIRPMALPYRSRARTVWNLVSAVCFAGGVSPFGVLTI
ncbi:hypothetical protein [Treponema endosymbiont of Eucomonympha sp.]|uniref:hypothetical protein n=1 Tax=Treponema endosymbiont of Eucomonympha sp. TaxID=1580831 RepID=UPI001E5E15C0|nr:hypothetical protein [Treponema endosymbiont of Eucomonympha sp.]